MAAKNCLNTLKRSLIAFIKLEIITVYFIIISAACLFFWPIQLLVCLLAKIFRPDLKGHLSGLHAFFAQGDKANFPVNMVGKAVLSNEMTIERLRELFHERVMLKEGPDGKRLFRKLTFYWTTFLGYTFWKEDKNFNLNNHLRKYKSPAPLTDTEIQKLMGTTAKVPWKKNQSPWETILVKSANADSKTVLILKMNHVLGDGFSLQKIFEAIAQAPYKFPEFKISARRLTPIERFGLIFKIPYDIVSSLFSVLMETPLPLQRDAEHPKNIYSPSQTIPVEVIKSIKTHYTVSYNAVLYSALCGAISRALFDVGEIIPENLVTCVVLPNPDHPGGLCIYAYVALAKFPLRSAAPEDRLVKVHKELTRVVNSSTVYVNDFTARLNVLLPNIVHTYLCSWFYNFIPLSVGTGLMPVTTEPTPFDGMFCLEMNCSISVHYNLGMMVSFSGVDNRQIAGFCISSNMFASEDVAFNFGKYFDEEMQALVDSMA